MRILPIFSNKINQNNSQANSNPFVSSSFTNSFSINNQNQNDFTINNQLKTDTVSFGSVNNQSPKCLKNLYAYDIPCIYTGKTMVDPKEIDEYIRAGVFKGRSDNAVQVLNQYEKSMFPHERQLFNAIKQTSKTSPAKSLVEIVKEMTPKQSRILATKQKPIVGRVRKDCSQLPKEMQEKVAVLVANSQKQINNKPIQVEYSKKEFLYDYEKTIVPIYNHSDKRTKKVLSEMTKLAKSLDDKMTKYNKNYQKNTINQMTNLLSNPRLKRNEELTTLIENTKKKINNEPVIVPFLRKPFIYKLHEIIHSHKDADMVDQIITRSSELPTSTNDFSAFVLKYSRKNSNEIAKALLYESYGSIEHLAPRGNGGSNTLKNTALATRKANSDRSNMPFVLQLEEKPNTAKYCQKYVDRLIELANDGNPSARDKRSTFEKLGIEPDYINSFRNTICILSEGKINLDVSKLKYECK